MTATYPTPLMLAGDACHMLTALVFLDGDSAHGAFLEFHTDGPIVQKLALGFITSLSFMPGNHEALEAKILGTRLALYLEGILSRSLNNDILTLGVRTELFRVTAHDLLINFEPPILVKRLFFHYLSDKFFI